MAWPAHNAPPVIGARPRLDSARAPRGRAHLPRHGPGRCGAAGPHAGPGAPLPGESAARRVSGGRRGRGGGGGRAAGRAVVWGAARGGDAGTDGERRGRDRPGFREHSAGPARGSPPLRGGRGRTGRARPREQSLLGGCGGGLAGSGSGGAAATPRRQRSPPLAGGTGRSGRHGPPVALAVGRRRRHSARSAGAGPRPRHPVRPRDGATDWRAAGGTLRRPDEPPGRAAGGGPRVGDHPALARERRGLPRSSSRRRARPPRRQPALPNPGPRPAPGPRAPSSGSCWIATAQSPWPAPSRPLPTLPSSTRASSWPIATAPASRPGRRRKTASPRTCWRPRPSTIRGCGPLPNPRPPPPTTRSSSAGTRW